MMNPSGFFFYTFYSVGGKVDGFLGTGIIHWNDMVFACLAFGMSCIQLVQIFMYDRGQQGNITWWVVIFLIVLYIIVFVAFFIDAFSGNVINTHWDTFLIAGYAKAAITFVKYVPQVYLNWKRKSTVGWSLANVLLDLTGGSLSMLQIVIDTAVLGKSLFSSDAFNVVKFILSLMSIVFDSIFLFQHYCLYHGAYVAD